MTLPETLQHAKTRFEMLAEDFDKAGDTVSRAMCNVDAEMMEKAIAALSDQVVVRRAWLSDVRDQMMKMKLESGPASDYIFLLREMLKDILDRPSPVSPAVEGK